MAINVNKVYKTVLSVLNKEQRGYLTPYEFNNIATQAQKEILEKLFYDYNKFLNLDNFNRINEGVADIPTKIQEQIDEFYAYTDITLANGIGTLPTDLFRLIDVTITNQTVQIEKIDKNRLPYLKSSPLTEPSTLFPVYYQRAADIVVEPAATDGAWTLGDVRIQYIQTPDDPRWGYTIDGNYGLNIYDPNVYSPGGIIPGIRNNNIISTNATVGLTDGTHVVSVGTDGVTTSGSGTGAVFSLTVSGSTVTQVNVTSSGTNFSVDDTITIPATTTGWLGGDDVVLTLRIADMYDSSTEGSTDFTLHISNETELVLTILGYAGLTIKDPQVLQAATQIGQAGTMSKANQ